MNLYCPIEPSYWTKSTFNDPILPNRTTLLDTILSQRTYIVQYNHPIGQNPLSTALYCPIEPSYWTISSLNEHKLSNRTTLLDKILFRCYLSAFALLFASVLFWFLFSKRVK